MGTVNQNQDDVTNNRYGLWGHLFAPHDRIKRRLDFLKRKKKENERNISHWNRRVENLNELYKHNEVRIAQELQDIELHEEFQRYVKDNPKTQNSEVNAEIIPETVQNGSSGTLNRDKQNQQMENGRRKRKNVNGRKYTWDSEMRSQLMETTLPKRQSRKDKSIRKRKAGIRGKQFRDNQPDQEAFEITGLDTNRHPTENENQAETCSNDVIASTPVQTRQQRRKTRKKNVNTKATKKKQPDLIRKLFESTSDDEDPEENLQKQQRVTYVSMPNLDTGEIPRNPKDPKVSESHRPIEHRTPTENRTSTLSDSSSDTSMVDADDIDIANEVEKNLWS